MPYTAIAVVSPIQIQSLDPRGRAMFCARLAQKLPPLPSGIEVQMGESNTALISSVLHALESAANDESIDPRDLSIGLRTITAIAQRKADEVEKRMYRAGDNYGFFGAADTYSEIYRYLAAYARTVGSAAELDVERCISGFRTALKLYGMYSTDGDPKGAIGNAIEAAEETAATALADVYASVPEALRQWNGELAPPPSAEPSVQRKPASPASAPTTYGEDRHQVFICYSHQDQKWAVDLQTILKPLVRSGAIEVWVDTKIRPGANWKDEIEKALSSSKVAVLLVSQHFLASDFIANKELPPLFRTARGKGLTIFWIYVGTCLYEVTEISDFQAAHEISRSLDRMSVANRTAVLTNICRRIKDSLP